MVELIVKNDQLELVIILNFFWRENEKTFFMAIHCFRIAGICRL